MIPAISTERRAGPTFRPGLPPPGAPPLERSAAASPMIARFATLSPMGAESVRGETIARHLDAIFDGYEPEQGNGFSGNLLRDCAYEVEVGDGEKMYPNGEEASWIIKILDPLPESLWSQADLGDDEQQLFVALMYSVEAEVAKGAFSVPGAHHWDEYIQFPCRDLSVSVCEAPGTKVAIDELACDVSLHKLSAPLPEETERCNQSIPSAEVSGKKVVRISYPLQGGIYRTYWKTMRTVGTDPCTM